MFHFLFQVAMFPIYLILVVIHLYMLSRFSIDIGHLRVPDALMGRSFAL